MATTFCSSFWLFSVSFTLSLSHSSDSCSLSLSAISSLFRSTAIIFIFWQSTSFYSAFGSAHFHSQSYSHPASMPRRRGNAAGCPGVQESSTQMRAGNGRLINACIDGIRTYTHTHHAYRQRHTLIHPHADTHA